MSAVGLSEERRLLRWDFLPDRTVVSAQRPELHMSLPFTHLMLSGPVGCCGPGRVCNPVVCDEKNPEASSVSPVAVTSLVNADPSMKIVFLFFFLDLLRRYFISQR